MVAHWFIVDQMCLLRRFFNSVIMLNAILSIAGSSHQGHERFSEISMGRQCSFMSFSLSRFPCGTGILLQLKYFSRRRQDVLECTWKSKYSRYRHIVPDLPAKSSSLDSSITRHRGHSTKSIARWGNTIAFWGPVQTPCFCRAELNSGIKFDKSTAEARRLNQTFESGSASN